VMDSGSVIARGAAQLRVAALTRCCGDDWCGSVGDARCGSVRRVTPALTASGGITSGDVARPSTRKKWHSESASKLDGERGTANGFGNQWVAHLSASDGSCLELGRDSGTSSFRQGA
jgi:hypothetical protein